MFKHFRLPMVILASLIVACAIGSLSQSDTSAITRLNIKVEPTMQLTVYGSGFNMHYTGFDPSGNSSTTNGTGTGIMVVTNNSTGFTAYMVVDGTDLVNKSNPDYTIPSITQAVENTGQVPRNSWGIYLYGDQKSLNGYSESDGVAPIRNGHILAYSNASTLGSGASIAFCSNVDISQPSGSYERTIRIVAIANRVPSTIDSIDYLQDVDSDVIASMTTGTQYMLYDKRDEKGYFVSKLADGKVWMTQNLDFTLSAEGTELDPATSDVQTTKTITAVTDTTNWGQSNTTAYFKDGGELYFPNGTDTAVDASSLDHKSDDLHYHIGSYYSWYAATAGSGDGLSADEDAEESICPAGWRLPTSNSNLNTQEDYSFNTLAATYNFPTTAQSGLETTLTATPLWFNYARQVDGTHDWTTTPTTAAYWSSRAAASSQAYALIATFDSVNEVHPNATAAIGSGFAVRCVFKTPQE
ncbi:hypothetical protein IKX64_02215 [Candidatus Saccharibacteria bacterium]|nr:hypothetical protein [Candidatus Saccharibacteria bacterium]